jgi:head-tail adaptor
MRSGLLNERLTVYELATTIAPSGAKTVEPVAVASYWCRVLHSQHERSDSDVEREVYNPQIRFELRASVPISDANIIEHDDMKYVIDMIEKNHNTDRQILYCTRYEQ